MEASGAGSRSMLAAGSGRDVEQLSRLVDVDLVPGAGGARRQPGQRGPRCRNHPFVQLEVGPNTTRQEVEHLIGVRVHLSSVREGWVR